MTVETLLSILVGIGLSAACGFRVFVPLLVMSIASLSGHLTLSDGFAWIGTCPALVAFAVATLAEIAGYYIPWIDHLLDIIATPFAVVAGIIVMASSVVGVSPFLRWTLAILAGGGVAGTFQAITGLTRASSTVTTAGLGNPILASVEAAGATVFSILSIAVPVIALALTVLVLAFVYRIRRILPGGAGAER
jgi:hypothetical protein